MVDASDFDETDYAVRFVDLAPAPEAFAGWWTPKRALAHVATANEPTVAVGLIVHRASIGRVRAAAEQIVYPVGDERDAFDMAGIPASWWGYVGDVLRDPAGPFWTATVGELTVNPDDGVDVRPHHFSGVRFESSGITALTDSSSAEVVPSADTRKLLPEAEQRRFCELLVSIHSVEAATESFARRALAAMYPDYSVSRDAFRDLLRSIRELNGQVPRGRPRVAGK